ncbi:MAG: alkaline phosphatase family protein [Sedimentisphaerales bacterium]|nr:alkaline phosphatase family protein [Sedimentisphaerales bacterium]
MNRKVLIIGIDGGTWSNLMPAMKKGCLPHIKDLLTRGSSGVLKSTMPALTAAAWSSFQTGMNPGENGVYDFFRWDRRRQIGILVNSSNLRDTLWDQAGRAGKRLGVVNVPMTYPAREVNGYMVTGLLTPSIESSFTWPPELQKELIEAIPDYDILTMKNSALCPGRVGMETFVRQMRQNLEYRRQVAERIIYKEPLDLFMVHFQAPDIIQHGLWAYMDETHPLYDSEKCTFIFNQFYGHLDSCVEQVRRAFAGKNGDDFLTFIISDHGFQKHQRKFSLDNWLFQNRYVFYQAGEPTFKKPLLVRTAKKLGIGKILRHVMPKKTIAKIEVNVGLKEEHFDFDRSRVFAHWSCGEGFVFLLEKNEADRQATARELTTQLLRIKDPQNGGLVIEKVLRREDIYRGRYYDRMPDLLVIPQPGYSIAGGYKPHGPLWLDVDMQHDIHIGKHHPDGIFVAAGPEVINQENMKAEIIDIMPTILYYLNLPIRADSDGRVLQNIFSENFNQQCQIKTYSLNRDDHEDSPEVYSQEDKQKIADRLKDLGYL